MRTIFLWYLQAPLQTNRAVCVTANVTGKSRDLKARAFLCGVPMASAGSFLWFASV